MSDLIGPIFAALAAAMIGAAIGYLRGRWDGYDDGYAAIEPYRHDTQRSNIEAAVAREITRAGMADLSTRIDQLAAIVIVEHTKAKLPPNNIATKRVKRGSRT